MSMLAAAGIYLVLDVNSPLQGHHLNRYEPWSTYNHDYLKNVLRVVEQFSQYNNTLGFFAGNEIINDKISATVSSSALNGQYNSNAEFTRVCQSRGQRHQDVP